jgi:hypothetical protein
MSNTLIIFPNKERAFTDSDNFPWSIVKEDFISYYTETVLIIQHSLE